MKSKIKFNTQNFKQKFKIFTILFIIVACVYLLYFNDKIFVQTIIQDSLNNDIDNKSKNVENFDVSNYVDICKNRKTRFYDYRKFELREQLPVTVIDGNNNCENVCNTTPNCQFFAMKENSEGVVEENKCYLYTKQLDSSNIDTSTMKINVNCNSTILPVSSSSTNIYNGFGYVNKKYFENNKSKFSYIDAYLDKANEFVSGIKDADMKISQSSSADLARNNNDKLTFMGSWISEFANLIGYDKNNLATLNNSTNMFTENIEEDTKNIRLKELVNISKERPLLESKLTDIKNSGFVDNLFYTILAFIMVITIILLVLYRLNDNIIITDRFMIFYFIIIVSIFMFIRFMLNK